MRAGFVLDPVGPPQLPVSTPGAPPAGSGSEAPAPTQQAIPDPASGSSIDVTAPEGLSIGATVSQSPQVATSQWASQPSMQFDSGLLLVWRARNAAFEASIGEQGGAGLDLHDNAFDAEQLADDSASPADWLQAHQLSAHDRLFAGFSGF